MTITNCSIFKRYPVSFGSSGVSAGYEILVGRGITPAIADFLAQKTKDDRVIVVCDDYFKGRIASLTDALAKAGFSVNVYSFEGGKHHKNINEAMRIYEALEKSDFARDSTMIAVGGGVIGDLAGFVASTYLRGMNLIHVPSSLTAMIDSSIGGKVAINFRKTVNAIGNYYHPILNVIDLDFMDTLPPRDYLAGLAEIIKCAVIADKELFDYLDVNSEAVLRREEVALLKIIYRAIEIKLDHVRDDVREQSIRLKLNYGHTMGHAVEISTGMFEEVYRHGEGVAIGMVGAAHIARAFLKQGDEILKRHEAVLEKYGLPVKCASGAIGFDADLLKKECLRNIFKDKKKKDAMLRFVLPVAIGRCEVYAGIPDEMLQKAFDYIIGQ
ncbi:MAG: 3-dehydroquinate synthase [Deltaproteobacteria bacterium]|nr:3-dehydroquinate synthase [Deltaproteobacteria bacterium]